MIKLGSQSKNLLKKVFFLLLYKLYFQKGKDSKGLIVLTYHRIANEPDLDDPLKVSLSTFEQQILYLKRNFTIISGDQLAVIIKREEPFPEKACLITFDDGWKDNYTNAFPILRKYGVPAIVFVSTDYVGTNRIFWHEQITSTLIGLSDKIDISEIENRLSSWPKSVVKKIELITTRPQHLRRPIINELIEHLKGFGDEKNIGLAQELDELFIAGQKDKPACTLSWGEIVEMSRADIEIGSHGKSHGILTGIDERGVRSELIESKSVIEERTGVPVNFLAYPNGNFNGPIKRIAQEAGYLAGFTCQTGVNKAQTDPFELLRQHVHEDLSLGFDGQFSDSFFATELSCVRNNLKGLLRIARENVWRKNCV